MALFLAALSLDAVAANPVELGLVRWRRGFESAAREAREADKPLLVLFDEVPG